MNISRIKKYILFKKGSNIIIVLLQNRGKKEKVEGIIDNVYKNVFTIRLNNGNIRSFTYVDILTKNIRVYI